jgi:hypothetical protein
MFNWLREMVEQVRAEFVNLLPALLERDDHMADMVRHGIRRLVDADPGTLLWGGFLVVGVLIVVIGSAVPAIRNAGDGYFLRAGILLGGVALAKLLRPSRSQHG